MLELAFFERRGRIGVGAIRGGGTKNVTLVDDRGKTLKVSRGRLLKRLRARLEPADERTLAARLRELRATLEAQHEPLDRELLWAALEDGRGYELAELAALTHGGPGDAEVAAVVRDLSGDEGSKLALGFRLVKGRIERLDAETRDRLREREERQQREREEHGAFLAWYRTTERAGAPPPELAPLLERLERYALEGERAEEAKAARRLARELGCSTADALLVELEGRGVLPRDVNELPARAGLPVEFPPRALEEADALRAARPPADGEDLRALPTVAVDDAETVEVDDAISAWEQDGALHFAVHICRLDLIAKGGALDHEALRRGTSVYFPGELVPMLPPEVVGELLSLEEGEDRRALSLVCRVGADSLPQGPQFVRSVVRVDRRLTYADEVAGPPDVVQRLVPVAQALREARRARGATVYSLPHLKLELDAAGEPHPLRVGSDTPAHLVVSELMVLYNARLGEELSGAGVPAYYRTQPLPPVPPGTPSLDPTDPLYPLLVRRSLRPTVVTTEPGPQRSMGLAAYVQATSPLRRMSDLIAQRQMLALLEGRPAPYDRHTLEDLRRDLEATARRARLLEEERRRYFTCRWLAARDELIGVVSRPRPMVYLPELDRELPCERLPHGAPPIGARVRTRVRKVSPRQGEALLTIVGEVSNDAGP